MFSSNLRSASANHRQLRLSILGAITCLGLTACGSGSDSPETMTELPASSVTTEQLQRNASMNAGKNIGANVDSIFQTVAGSNAINSMLSTPGISQFFAADISANDDPGGNRILDDDLGANASGDIDGVIDATLGLTGTATTTRFGSRVTIDPDEQRVCEEQLIGMSSDAAESAQCVLLFADLTVHIDAISDQSGQISYIFQEQPVLTIEYSPTSGSYELQLAGAHALLTRLAELDSESDPVPEVMEGAVKVQATVHNETIGSEAGTFSISISEHLNLVNNSTSTNLSIAPSTVLEVTTDEAAGTAGIELNIGALQIATTDNDIIGNPITRLALSGLTARADLTRNGDVLEVSNLGIGNGPLTVTVDSIETVRATLDTFGFSVNQEVGHITLLGDLNYNLMLNNAMGFLDASESNEFTANYSVNAPIGTVLSEQLNSTLKVEQGGPVDVTYAVSDGPNSANGTVSVSTGNCFDDDAFTDAPVSEAACE